MKKPAFFFALLLAAALTPARATVVIPLSLQQVAERASLIFQGKVTAQEARFDDISQRVATYTTFEVLDIIKGSTGKTHTIKQVGGQLPGSKVALRVHGVPRFTLGEEYVVFLPEPSRLGFASPVGLSQGSYSVFEQNGSQRVSNHFRGKPAASNAQLTPAVADKSVTATTPSNNKAARTAPGFTSLDNFKSTVRSMVSQ